MLRRILHSALFMKVLLSAAFLSAAVLVHYSDNDGTSSSALVFSSSPAQDGVAYTNQVSPGSSLHHSYEPPLLSPAEGYGGPVLVISSATNHFSRYTVEILRAEGLNCFTTTNITRVTMATLDTCDIVILGEMAVTESQVAMFTEWVNNGGTLITFRPGVLLAPLLGIKPNDAVLKDKYLLIKSDSGPGTGITDQTIQFHGTADLFTLNGAESLATLYSNPVTKTTHPAITSNKVGSKGGTAIAFTYDLAKSIIYTRQGNPEWAGQKRDGQIDPIRSDDLFFPDWVNLDKVAIPQADEQQRLLINIILQNNLHRKPLPRFWYLPRDLKAAIVMTGDDHGKNETADRFNQYLALGSNTPEDVADWKAIRATSYIYPDTKMTNEQAVTFEKNGFEIALHPNTNCANYSLTSLQKVFAEQLSILADRLPGISPPSTNRTHCLTWSDWASTPKTEVQNGIRMDASYYYWPSSWIQNRPGMFTGSGLPMRFADIDGSMIDNYQLVTQMTDESGIDIENFCHQLLDRATGTEGYYGVFCANMHTDTANHTGSNTIIALARARQIPVISARQLLNWLDGRNNSFFSNIKWNNSRLSFNIIARNGAKNLKAMLPVYSETGQLVSITMNGAPLTYTTQTIKGMLYAFFLAAPGNHAYIADYKGSPMRTTDQVVTLSERFKNDQLKITAVFE